MTDKTIRETFDKIWNLDKKLGDFQITKNVEGRKLQLRIKGCGLTDGGSKSPTEIFSDDYEISPICPDSKWLNRITGDLCDLEIHFEKSDAPKELKKELASLNNYLTKTFKDDVGDLVYIYMDAYKFNRKEQSFKDFYKGVKKLMEKEKEEKKQIALPLNSSYTAFFTKDGEDVEVGCQTFSKQTILKLASMI